MKTQLQISLKLILAFGCANFLMACQPLKELLVPGTKNFGTSDTGGGTGIDGKVYESYIVNIAQHPAFLDYVKPIFKNIKDPKSSSTEESKFEDNILNYKTWYIAPVDLERVGKDTLGISFQENQTQQIARQTRKEIWIDSRIFHRMSLKEQGDLILHEVVMSLYFAKFLTFQEICDMSTINRKESDKVTDCSKVPDYFKDVMKPEPSRPLNAEDNENIRYVTGWLLQNGSAEISALEFVNLLRSKGFDKRLFNPDNYRNKEEPSELKLPISGRAVFNALKATELSGFMPDVCRDLLTQDKVPCRIEVLEGATHLTPKGYPTIELKVFIGERMIYDFQVLMVDETTLYGIRDEGGSIAYTFNLTSKKWGEKLKVGDKFTNAFLILRQNGSFEGSLRFDSLIARTTMLVSATPVGKMECEFRAPKKMAPYDLGIVIQRLDSPKEMAEAVYESVEFNFCSKSMIE